MTKRRSYYPLKNNIMALTLALTSQQIIEPITFKLF